MNTDILKGKWMQAKGQVKSRWGRLTNDEIDRLEGRAEELVGLLQERYGKARQEAEREVEQFCRNLENEFSGRSSRITERQQPRL